MARGIIIVDVKTITPLRNRLSKLESLSNKDFETMVRSARSFGHKQIEKHGRKIGANIFAVEEDYFMFNIYRVSGTFYKLNE